MSQDLPPAFMGDLSHLPTHGHGNRSLTWWGMMALVAIESTAFVLAVAAYFYLANQVPAWPPREPRPSLLCGSVFTVLALVSLAPNLWLKRRAETEALGAVQVGLVVMSLVGIVMLPIRYAEFAALNVAWSDSAYGSITVTLLGLHTVHLVTDLVYTLVLTALMFTRHAHGRRFVDVAENAIYWNFVVLAWVPIYAVLYFAPRWL
jgi:cytochrome c oxidase subunit III